MKEIFNIMECKPPVWKIPCERPKTSLPEQCNGCPRCHRGTVEGEWRPVKQEQETTKKRVLTMQEKRGHIEARKAWK